MKDWAEEKAAAFLYAEPGALADFTQTEIEEYIKHLAALLREVRDECVCSACGDIAIHQSEQ